MTLAINEHPVRKIPLLVSVAMILITTGSLMADDSPATGPAPDKSIYTLFHPVPGSLLRDMETDRPDHTNTPDTIDAGHVQLETGLTDLTFFRHGSARNDLYSTGEENLRVGVLNQLELSASVSLFNSMPVASPNAGNSHRKDGIGDLYLGGTANLWGDDDGDTLWATSLGLQPVFKIPTASQSIGNGHFEAYFGIPFLVNLPGGFHLASETIVSDERNSADNGNVTGWQNMFAVDHVVLEKFDVYGEYWSHLTTEQHRKTQQSIDTGFTYSLTDSIVLDTGFNFGLNSATADFDWVTGVSLRW